MTDLDAIALVQKMRENLSGSTSAEIRRTRQALDRVIELAAERLEERA